MKSNRRLALLTLLAVASLTGCRSPTDINPTPPDDEEEEEPGTPRGGGQAFLSFDGAPILV
ncbi:MAG TPA: hypothetical protein VMM12_09180 [Longimicrobiales bacterium]|nr:hypothetical protein [Longimicrobiales bacterium]